MKHNWGKIRWQWILYDNNLQDIQGHLLLLIAGVLCYLQSFVGNNFLLATIFCWLQSSVGYNVLLTAALAGNNLLMVTILCWLQSCAGYNLVLATVFCWLQSSAGYNPLLVTIFCWLQPSGGYNHCKYLTACSDQTLQLYQLVNVDDSSYFKSLDTLAMGRDQLTMMNDKDSSVFVPVYDLLSMLITSLQSVLLQMEINILPQSVTNS